MARVAAGPRTRNTDMSKLVLARTFLRRWSSQALIKTVLGINESLSTCQQLC